MKESGLTFLQKLSLYTDCGNTYADKMYADAVAGKITPMEALQKVRANQAKLIDQQKRRK